MNTKITISSFGVCKNYQGKYYLVIDGKGHHDLSYSSKAFALKKAEQYAKRLHTNFTDGQGNKRVFEFENRGEVKELIYNTSNIFEGKHYIPVAMDFTVNEKTYTLCIIQYKGAEPIPDFSFKANNVEDAISKARDWALYHSICFREYCIVREATEHEANSLLHQEYVS